ncbi:MAG: IS66 family transposase [Clostridiales Family XIII bacterium]|jgi:transposase|nr:IS66 family transposase [Clostridiales Family XIII bacterium]
MNDVAKSEKVIDLSTMERAELEEYARNETVRADASEAKNKYYEELLRKMNAFRFGPSSERHVSDGQFSIFDEAEATQDEDAPEPKKSEVLPPPKQRKKKGHKKEIVKNLPKTVVEHVLTGDELLCPKCGKELTEMKTVARTEVEFTPATYNVVEHRSKVYSCRACDKQGIEGTIVTAASPKGLFRNSLASPSLVADILFKKYGLSLPLHRQEQELMRTGLNIKRNVLANWVIKAAKEYLMAIACHMHTALLAECVIHADETPIQVLKEPGKAATSDSYMWMYRTGAHASRKVVLLMHSPGRGAEYPAAHLAGYSGYIHTDGYSAYRVLLKPSGSGPPPDIVFVGCWGHARRKFTDIQKGLKKSESIKGTATEKALEYIGSLFKIEEEAKDFTPEARHAYRKKKATSVVDAYFAWCKRILPQCAGDSLRKAVNYSINQEQDLRKYLLDGRLEISNNLGENAIRPFCVGRRNWLFADTPAGADASAVCYSIIETCKANGVDPFEYINHVLTVFKDADIAALDMEDFMPWSPTLPDCCRKGGGTESLVS